MSTEAQNASYQWIKSTSGASSMSRSLTNLERMFVIFNKDLYGQNCPFIGASISLKHSDQPDDKVKFSVSELKKRAVEAFCQTRWRYPTVAARVVDETKAVYNIESKEQTREWAERTVRMVSQEGGWVPVRERVSRDAPIPSQDGDYCLMYIITRPDEAETALTTFDVLMHTHHVFTDGSGIRSILNEFLERLASPLAEEQVSWGKEVERLYPPSCLLVKEEEPEDGASSKGGVRLKGFGPDIGLPVYRPRLGPPSTHLRGTRLATHTFSSPTFLPQLLAVGRTHHVKLASVLHATLLKSVHETTDSIPGMEDFYKSGSALDLRNGWMMSPYDQKKEYVNSAVAIHPIEVPCKLFKEKKDFWKVAEYVGGLWDEIKGIKGMADTVERDAGGFIENWAKRSTNPTGPPAKPRTCPYFVSDPPGSHLLSPSFPVAEFKDLKFVLDSYQLATDQNQAVISARSHSWNNKLTLCLVYNAARNPSDKMQEFLERWKANVEAVCEDRIHL